MDSMIVATEATGVDTIKDRILEIRGQRVMLDRDLAALYGVETKRLNEAVKRNINRFPEDFMFVLTDEEWLRLRSQIATSNDSDGLLGSQNATSKRGGTRYRPYAFTEYGVAMLSSVLRSETASGRRAWMLPRLWWKRSRACRVRPSCCSCSTAFPKPPPTRAARRSAPA